MNYLIIVILLTFSALFSGLTLGLMSLSAQELKRKKALGDKDAARVYPIRKNGNILLCTLLIGNVAINSILSIFLGSIISGWMAVLIATALIVIFGEIAPQAVFSRFALMLGAKTVWIVRIFMFVLYPICRPLAWILDKTLGSELPTIYSKKELIKIIEEHEDTPKSDIDEEEEKIIKGALSFSDKIVENVMTPKSVVIAFEASQKIDNNLFDKIQNSGHSRFPVYSKTVDNVVGILYAIQLLGCSDMDKTVGTVASKKVFFINKDKKLDDALNAFISTRNHLFIATNEFGDVVGVVALEDVLEEIINTEIMDERDKYEDLQEFAKKQQKKRMSEIACGISTETKKYAKT